MSDANASRLPPPPLEHFRSYLRALTELQIGRGLQAKVDASDIVQQTLLDAHIALPNFRGGNEAELRAWLRTILSNNLLNAVRGLRAAKRDARREVSLAQQIEQSSVHLEGFLATDRSSPSQGAMRNERAERLASALKELPEDQRLAVILKHFHGWTIVEISGHMQRTQGAIAGLLKRGLDRLRALVEADG
jgi:RNA polymerase sigma-70 factor (ECF subfamily)